MLRKEGKVRVVIFTIYCLETTQENVVSRIKEWLGNKPKG